jgi:hypothetical protein
MNSEVASFSKTLMSTNKTIRRHKPNGQDLSNWRCETHNLKKSVCDVPLFLYLEDAEREEKTLKEREATLTLCLR